MRRTTILASAIATMLAVAPFEPTFAVTSGVVDGLGTGGGRIQARISPDTASVVRDGVAWVAYGANPEYGYRLRLARLGSPPTFRTLDGAGGPDGRTAHSVATDVSATIYQGAIHIFYRDETTDALRHAWHSDGGWSFETLDGDGGAGGRTTHDVGSASAAIADGGRLHVVYRDVTAGDVRRATFDGTSWGFSILDGAGGGGGRITAAVGGAIDAAVVGGRLRVVYTRAPAGLRQATRSADGTWTYATISSLGTGPVALRPIPSGEALLAYAADGDIYAARWDGAWSVDQPVSSVESVRGLTIVVDGGTPFLAASLSQCFGSGGCDRLVGIVPWNGTTFDDPYYGGLSWSGEPPGAPTSGVTVGGVGMVFVGGFGHLSEPDIYDQVLLRIRGPF